ncbi:MULTISPECIES: hypothetical protein [unclassified Paenibacillus]|uniref:hypothetical protein n=1 Tax=unclassified Paenibacillus TaxID=185978 RepID=UPI00096DB13D|nr:hypothetical protein [Paenibacillus sp. FSL H8-0259]OMF31206.1 hypothetical protein BK132_07270 [Paenibacillus sp. FSL H8-0259]
MEGMAVHYDNCKGGFHIDLQQRRLEDAAEEIYFICPYCQTEYPSFYTDTNVREKQRSIGKLRERFNALKDPVKRDALQERIERDQAEVKALMAELKLKYKPV